MNLFAVAFPTDPLIQVVDWAGRRAGAVGGHRTGAAGEVLESARVLELLERGALSKYNLYHCIVLALFVGTIARPLGFDSSTRLCEPVPHIRSSRDSWQFMQFQAESADMSQAPNLVGCGHTFALCPGPSWPYLPPGTFVHPLLESSRLFYPTRIGEKKYHQFWGHTLGH